MQRRRVSAEALLLALGLSTLVALLLRAGVQHPATLEVGAVTALLALGLSAPRRAASAQPDWGRYALYGVYLGWFYLAVRRIVPALGVLPRDDLLLRLDVMLLGQTPAVWLDAAVHPVLTELMSAAYLIYHVYLVVVVVGLLRRPLPEVRTYFVRGVRCFSIGFAGYLLVPAMGPHLAHGGLFANDLGGGLFTYLNQLLVGHGSSVYDVFPSLHVLGAAVLLDLDRRAHPVRFWIFLPPCLAMVVSTMYLRYHYAVDVTAALLLFPLVRSDGGPWEGFRPPQNPQGETKS